MATWDVLHVRSLEVDRAVGEDQIRTWLAEGSLSRDDCVRRSGDERWWRIYELREFRVDTDARTAEPDEPPRLEVDSLRKLLADVELTSEPSPKPRRVSIPAPPRDRGLPARQAEPTTPSRGIEPPPEPPASEPLFPPKKRLPEQEDIDMAPACTVSFLLILFFVIASTIALQMAIAFPKPAPEDRAEARKDFVQKNWDDLRKDNIVVEIKADNTIWIDNEQRRGSELVNQISNLKRDRGTLDLILKADEEAYHETVVMVVDAAARAGMQNIKLANVTKVAKKAKKKRMIKN